MILIPHILLVITLLFLTTYWRIKESLLWSEWAIFTILLLGLLAAFVHEIIQNF